MESSETEQNILQAEEATVTHGALTASLSSDKNSVQAHNNVPENEPTSTQEATENPAVEMDKTITKPKKKKKVKGKKDKDQDGTKSRKKRAKANASMNSPNNLDSKDRATLNQKLFLTGSQLDFKMSNPNLDNQAPDEHVKVEETISNVKDAMFSEFNKSLSDFEDKMCCFWIHGADELAPDPLLLRPVVRLSVFGK
jgi:preprotein translocase subunit SecD